MTTSPASKIAKLNDQRRQAWGVYPDCRYTITQGIQALPSRDQSAVIEKVESFSDFTADNDPHGEHDFWAFTVNGKRIFWKFDYYDRASFRTRHEMGSEAPPTRTRRSAS